MRELQVPLILTLLALGLIALGVWIIRAAKRSRRSMAPLAGLLLMLGAFFPPDPPPPPASERVVPDQDDAPKDPKARIN